jgi:hypothetical protein
MGTAPIAGEKWEADVALDPFSLPGTRDGLQDARPLVTESSSAAAVGKAYHVAKGDRWTAV